MTVTRTVPKVTTKKTVVSGLCVFSQIIMILRYYTDGLFPSLRNVHYSFDR